MGLYTKKVKEDAPAKEVKVKTPRRPGRPKKSEPIEEKEPEVEQPKLEEPAPVEPEKPKEPEVQAPPPPREKTPPPPEPVKEPEPLKKDPVKKKVVKKVEKVEKKTAPKDEEPPAWFKKFISEVSYEPKATKKENKDMVKEIASNMWNKGVKPSRYGQTEQSTPNSYEKLYNQIFGR
jgi:hypothetical protein